MKFLVYNIAYGTGSPGGEAKRLLTTHRYLRTPVKPFGGIAGFIRKEQPDIIGLIEADAGSFRTNRRNHAALLATQLGNFNTVSTPKYGSASWLNRMPYLKHQHNALLTRHPMENFQFHYMARGTKKLIISGMVDGVHVLLVHLALSAATRQKQLLELAKYVDSGRPTIIAGDFNTFNGELEITRFCRELQLLNANQQADFTYPAWQPRQQLDYILYTPSLKLRDFRIPQVEFSDHLPLIAEFDKK